MRHPVRGITSLLEYNDLVGVWKVSVVADMRFARCFLPDGYGEQDSTQQAVVRPRCVHETSLIPQVPKRAFGKTMTATAVLLFT